MFVCEKREKHRDSTRLDSLESTHLGHAYNREPIALLLEEERQLSRLRVCIVPSNRVEHVNIVHLELGRSDTQRSLSPLDVASLQAVSDVRELDSGRSKWRTSKRVQGVESGAGDGGKVSRGAG